MTPNVARYQFLIFSSLRQVLRTGGFVFCFTQLLIDFFRPFFVYFGIGSAWSHYTVADRFLADFQQQQRYSHCTLLCIFFFDGVGISNFFFMGCLLPGISTWTVGEEYMGFKDTREIS